MQHAGVDAQEVLTAMEGLNRTHMAGSPGRMKWLGCYCISALPGLNVSLCKGIQWHDLVTNPIPMCFMMFIEYFKIVFVFNCLVHFFSSLNSIGWDRFCVRS